MNEHEIELVQTSWAAVEPIADVAAMLFYNRLFETAPEVRGLFPDDVTEQGRKLMAMLRVVVNGLDRLDALVPAVADLGRRHTGYGAAPAHYDAVGAALLWTLAEGLGEAFTPEVEDAWATAYGMLAATMIQAAGEAQAA
jgi:nitric oxide dioxygenase